MDEYGKGKKEKKKVRAYGASVFGDDAEHGRNGNTQTAAQCKTAGKTQQQREREKN